MREGAFVGNWRNVKRTLRAAGVWHCAPVGRFAARQRRRYPIGILENTFQLRVARDSIPGARRFGPCIGFTAIEMVQQMGADPRLGKIPKLRSVVRRSAAFALPGNSRIGLSPNAANPPPHGTECRATFLGKDSQATWRSHRLKAAQLHCRPTLRNGPPRHGVPIHTSWGRIPKRLPSIRLRIDQLSQRRDSGIVAQCGERFLFDQTDALARQAHDLADFDERTTVAVKKTVA